MALSAVASKQVTASRTETAQIAFSNVTLVLGGKPIVEDLSLAVKPGEFLCVVGASGCGMGYEATMYLLERGVRLTGIDGWSWDAPFVYTAKKYAETKDASLIWEGHKAGRHIGYCHIEKLHNLEILPSTGFMVSCFPVKIERASAGWTRAVAIIDG